MSPKLVVVALALLVLRDLREVEAGGILCHKDSETRNSVNLNGIWQFAVSNTSDGVVQLEIASMTVPASYNDFASDNLVRDYVGTVWYDRDFFVPKAWSTERVWIRFSSVTYAAQVWVNNQPAASHVIGNLPFQVEITKLVKFGKKNHIQVSVDNILSETSIPQGTLTVLNNGRIEQLTNFEHYPFAGIDRPVTIFTTPKTYIDDITITTDIDVNNNGVVKYQIVTVGCDCETVTASVKLIDKNQNIVITQNGTLNGTITVSSPNLWWPLMMNDNPGYLYDLRVELLSTDGTLVDVYIHKVGIRKLKWDHKSFTINGKPLYWRGFAKHHDSEIRGNGLDLAVIMRDHHLLKWIGANGYRSSGGPLPDEVLDLADSLGILIINEVAATSVNGYSDGLLTNHKQSVAELIKRDKNRPSVIMWSLASQCDTSNAAYGNYIKQVIDYSRTLDTTRAITIVSSSAPEVDVALQYVDVVLFSSFQGWRDNYGDIDTIYDSVNDLVTRYHTISNSTVICAEYGAFAESGYHNLPVDSWSEDYQIKLVSEHFRSFDNLYSQGFFIGESIWNFADSKSSKKHKHRGRNGIFDKHRQPKACAHHLRKRYWHLAKKIDKTTKRPGDLWDYVGNDVACDD